ncbi:MAG: DUF2505 domain-containing protein [Ilumatobacteraceae bacterium]
MKVVSMHTYAAPPDVVFEAMTDPAVLAEKYAALGHRNIEIIEHSVSRTGVAVHSRREVPMEVPGFARRLLSPTNTVEQHDRWGAAAADGTRTGTWEVAARGVPVKVGGTLHLAPAPGGTVVEIHGDVSSSVPLIGGKLASFIGHDVERTMHAEEAFNDEYLSRVAPKPKPRRRSGGA